MRPKIKRPATRLVKKKIGPLTEVHSQIERRGSPLLARAVGLCNRKMIPALMVTNVMEAMTPELRWTRTQWLNLTEVVDVLQNEQKKGSYGSANLSI
jgi:hypothetical protein